MIQLHCVSKCQLQGRRGSSDNGWAMGAYRGHRHSQEYHLLSCTLSSSLQLPQDDTGDHMTRLEPAEKSKYIYLYTRLVSVGGWSIFRTS